jgi:PAS domain S-box-containing protein
MGIPDDDLGRLALLNHKLGDQEVDPLIWPQIVDALPDGLVVIDDRARIQLVNVQVELTFGYHRSRLIGESVHVLLDPAIAGTHASHVERFFASPSARPMNVAAVLSGRHASGRVVRVQVSIGPLVSESGVYALAVVRRVAGGG